MWVIHQHVHRWYLIGAMYSSTPECVKTYELAVQKTPFFCGWTPKVLVKVSHLQIEKKLSLVVFLGVVFFSRSASRFQRLPTCPGLMSASAEDCQSHRLSNEFKPSTSPRCNSRMLLDHGNSKLKTLKKWERSPSKGFFSKVMAQLFLMRCCKWKNWSSCEAKFKAEPIMGLDVCPNEQRHSLKVKWFPPLAQQRRQPRKKSPSFVDNPGWKKWEKIKPPKGDFRGLLSRMLKLFRSLYLPVLFIQIILQIAPFMDPKSQ